MKTMSKVQLEEFVESSKAKGKMPKVIFCCGAVLVNGLVRIYYGAGDTVIGTASAKIKDFFKG